jgi:uncharacterized membrane protein
VAAVALGLSGCAAANDSGSAASETLVGLGHEPGWRVDIANDQLTLLADYGEIRLSMPAPAPEKVEEGRRYTGQADGHNIAIIVSERPCEDGATGLPRPYVVVLVLDGRTLNGCGGPNDPPRESDLPHQR